MSMSKDRYSFPAIFNYAADGISIEFPDLPGCLPAAHGTDEAFKNAREALGLHLWGMENDGEKIPVPSPVEKLHPKSGETLAMIEVFMPSIRARVQKQFIKKTLSIPAWLNAAAEEADVNFSLTLQNALMQQLDIDDPNRSQA
jgi:predicted RNase H-like HicB family nuclease